MREPFFQQGNTHQPFMGCADTGVDLTGLQENRLITSNPTEQPREIRHRESIFATLHGNRQRSITVVYAPTECSSSSVQEDLHIFFNEHLEQAKTHEIHLILGGF